MKKIPITREENWERYLRQESMERLFTPRIIADLTNIDIRVSSKHVNSILEGKGLFFTGPAGTGKTLQACATLLEAIKYKYVNELPFLQSEYMSVTKLLQMARDSYHRDGEGISSIIEKYSKIEMLILDEIGVDKPSEWVFQILYSIVDNRYESLLPTIYTSNIDLNDLRGLLHDDRIPSRILGTCAIITFDCHPDYRRTASLFKPKS